MTEEAVAVEGLTKVFPVPFHRKAIVAVRDLNLRVGPGEVYGLLGPNGSGKSTTLKIILGLVSPTHGRTKIFGRDSSLVESREAVGFLPENPYFYRFLTGEETLRFFGKLCRLNGSRLNDRVRELLELVGLTNARDQRLSHLLERNAATDWSRSSAR
jgi:ABC-2 type transport system ATP-binding protein